MKNIQISDITLENSINDEKGLFTFREKIEAAKLLEKVGVSVIELGRMTGQTADILLIKSIASSVKKSTVAVCTGFDKDETNEIWTALKEVKSPRIQVCAAASTTRMEYVYHKKPDDLVESVCETVAYCKSLCNNIEFIADDATRAKWDFLCRIVKEAISSGAGTVTVCDTAGVMLPGEFGIFIEKLYADIPELKSVNLGVRCSNELNVADASAISAIGAGANEIKTSAIDLNGISLLGISKLLAAKSHTYNVTSNLKITEINTVLKSIEGLGNKGKIKNSPFEDGVRKYPDDMTFTENDGIEEIIKGAEFLGYELDENDKVRVWNAFKKILGRKDKVGIDELEAIIASEAMQVTPTYTLENYVVTTGNAIDILAHIKLKRDGKLYDGLSIGDGPIDAAFLAIEKITGHHYELDDFQIRAITEGREAMGQSVVKLRSNGKVYSGIGISTDIIGSGVAAYVNALNKIIFEEENQ